MTEWTTHHVPQGTMQISRDANTVFTTVLGSCVATCLYDEEAGVGGLNHVLLPPDLDQDPFGSMAQVNLMEQLINALLRQGARRDRLKGKIFGGASMLGRGEAIGKTNAGFVQRFLREEEIPCVSQSLGGNVARRVRFWPATGRAQQRFVTDAVHETVAAPAKSAATVELF